MINTVCIFYYPEIPKYAFTYMYIIDLSTLSANSL